MRNRHLYRTPAVRWGYDPKDQPIGEPALLHTKRGPVRARAPGLDIPAPPRQVSAPRNADDESAAHPS